VYLLHFQSANQHAFMASTGDPHHKDPNSGFSGNPAAEQRRDRQGATDALDVDEKLDE
jgi:hypothetical protein